MSVRIQLDNPHNCFTNLDFISGRVILSLVYNETIAGIVVKLEGESRTRLIAPTYDNYRRSDREDMELEVHKLLYKVQTVFPTPDLQSVGQRNASYTLPPGQFEYPFRFKIPFNNDCVNNDPSLNNSGLGGFRFELNRPASRHVRKTLPPSLNGLPGQAEIQYYLKVTVQRPAFYKENFRSLAYFKFFPIEAPRPPENRRESYARRQHQFAPAIPSPTKPGFFGKASPAQLRDSAVPPTISVDARLPDPPILTCNEPLPLRILLTKTNESSATIYLQSLHLELIAQTDVRAHELRRTNTSNFIILSTRDLRQPLTTLVGTGKEHVVDNRIWKTVPLPNTVPPTFETCNISRNYFLNITIGLSWGSEGNINPDLTLQPLNIAVQVYSGIAPPAALLDRISSRPTRPTQAPIRPSNPQPQPASQPAANAPVPQSHPPAPVSFDPGPNEIPDDAPPSYEDALADDLAPVDGPRRNYDQQSPQNPPDGNEKGSTTGERLFPGE